jgi:RNA polymerase sigma-70 factor (ECF subfamily)
LVSETFLDVWHQAGQFEGQSPASTWLLSIARFKAFSALRRRSDEELHGETARTLVDTADDPEVAILKKDNLRRCLTTLTPAHREMIDLVYYHEKSIEEVAEIVGISQNTVKTRVYYARRLSYLLKVRGVDRD